ncbi:ferrous iron transport protein B [Desulfococcaceae bacterium HSG9]|nr:ferrous iron transport protein B [Desulfococcaceae bacterium HSG9]
MKATIALAGNPNAGKTTFFNALTGARQHVGNYPGVTVEKKEGTCIHNSSEFNIVDLPGTYSLTAYSPEELVARDFIVKEKPGVVINIADASNLERNLYLTLQFKELGVPVCIALNMMDVAKKRGIEIDISKLSKLMQTPVIPTVARTGQGKTELMSQTDTIVRENKEVLPLEISYGDDIDPAIAEMEDAIIKRNFLTETYPAQWIALKYMENDEQIKSAGDSADADFSAMLDGIVKRVSDHTLATLDLYPEAIIADHRYGYIRSVIKQGVIKYRHNRNRLHISDKIDQVATNRFAGPLIMVAVIFALYHFTFTYSAMPVGWIEALFGWLGSVADANLADGMLKSLIISGVIDGVGGVMGFVPLIMFMFFGIALLEDSGYFARVAFMLDRVFRIFGLHGSSVMPFIISGGIAGGCAVPGVMATRTLKSPRERMATLLTVPFMNCGAKLPVFAVLVAAFFADNEAEVMLLITLIAWAGALSVAKLLRITVIKGPATPFVMELPPYRLPTFKGLAIHTWERTWQYIKKAGTIILGISIILWAMMTFPGLPNTESQKFDNMRKQLKAAALPSTILETDSISDNGKLSEPAKTLKEQLTALDSREAEAALKFSVAGRMGTALEFFSSWAGFDWRTNIALVGGFAAKEIVVSTLGTAYSLGAVDSEETGSLSEVLAKSPDWSPLTAFSLIVFMIFYAPCFVTIVSIIRESGSWKWGVFSMAFNTLLAFILATIVFQVGSALELLGG